MVIVIISIFFILLALLFLLMGIQFQRGKWLKLLAGNTFGGIPNDNAKIVGKSTSYCMYFASIFCFVLAFGIFRDNSKVVYFTIILVFFVGVVSIIYALSNWLKNG